MDGRITGVQARPTLLGFGVPDWRVGFAVWLVSAFLVLYLATQSPFLIGDGQQWANSAAGGDPSNLNYADPTHYLQIPLTRGVWLLLNSVGVHAPVEAVLIAISLAGTLLATVFVGLISGELNRSRTAAWLAAILFGASLHSWTQWNGDLYGLPLGFLAVAVYLTLRGKTTAPAILWGLVLLARAEFVLASPVFLAAVWLSEPSSSLSRRLRRTLFMLICGGVLATVVLFASAWALGKWSDASSMVEWMTRAFSSRRSFINAAEPARALKGLVTALSVAGHLWRDVLTDRGLFQTPAFVAAATAGLVVLVSGGIFVVAALARRGLLIFGLTWLLPFHLLLNWFFVPTVEKYHAGAFPGLVLLVTGGMLEIGGRLPARWRSPLYVGFLCLYAVVNLFGAVLPMKVFGNDTVAAAAQIRELGRDGQATVVACDATRAVTGAGVSYLRIRSIWRGSVSDIQGGIASWISDRLAEGRDVYLLDRYCFPEEWATTYSKERFDLYFLERAYQLTPTPITNVPIDQGASTNPFSWRRGDLMRVQPRFN